MSFFLVFTLTKDLAKRKSILKAEVLLAIYGRSIRSQLPTDKMTIKIEKRKAKSFFIKINSAAPAVTPGAQVSINLICSRQAEFDSSFLSQFSEKPPIEELVESPIIKMFFIYISG